MPVYLVYDGGLVTIPEVLGKPRPDQMLGTPAEQLSELAGRTCYDSLGSGRASSDYHAHIKAVNHGSVWEHFNYCIDVPDGLTPSLLREAANRPGVWTSWYDGGIGIKLCLNLRAAVEWRSPTRLGVAVAQSAHAVAPWIGNAQGSEAKALPWRFYEPVHDEEKWITLYMSGSRGFSHEQVRHKWRTAVSQRSTRYCDESESPWVEHPLVTAYKAANPAMRDTWPQIIPYVRDVTTDRDEETVTTIGCCRGTYRKAAAHLENWLINNGVDKVTARKQARGAARGYLGNALETEMLFSASVAQWRRMLKQRLNAAADAEIRVIYAEVLSVLRASRYGESFADLTTEPSPDGIGCCLSPTAAS
jgi:hypothetical protein